MEVVSLPIPAHPDKAIIWRDDQLYLLDQRVLPNVERYVHCRNAKETADAITEMVVRGAPAIGITAAYGIAVAVRERIQRSGSRWLDDVQKDLDVLAASRPTASNLFWAINRMRGLIDDDVETLVDRLVMEARQIHQEDVIANRLMGELGSACIEQPTSVITHCNAGGLATGGHGTAVGVIRTAHQRGKIKRVYADETRPWLQGSRLTAWELLQNDVPVSVIADNAASRRMQQGEIDWVIVGSDRIAANGDVANKIGTYQLAISARYHGVKFMVVAPTSTLDLDVASGDQIPIETRAGEELLQCGGATIGAKEAGTWNPVFDVTPAELVDVIVTERGVIRKPGTKGIRAIIG